MLYEVITDALGRRHENGSGDRELLGHCQLDVTGSRWHVDDEEVQLAPGDVFEELDQCRNGDGAAPDEGGILGGGRQGDAKGSRPGGFDFVGRAKFDAWSKLKGMNQVV